MVVEVTCWSFINFFLGCGGILTANNGVIESPNYPHSYPSDIICEWIINVPLGQSVALDFQEIDVERNDLCNFDAIQVNNFIKTSNIVTNVFF